MSINTDKTLVSITAITIPLVPVFPWLTFLDQAFVGMQKGQQARINEVKYVGSNLRCGEFGDWLLMPWLRVLKMWRYPNNFVELCHSYMPLILLSSLNGDVWR